MRDNDFNRWQQESIERMREMSAKSQINNNTAHKMPPIPPFVKMPENNRRNNFTAPAPSIQENEPPKSEATVNNLSYKNGLNIPFLDNLFKDSDSSLILGLLLILMSENADKMLLFALVYILL